MSVIYKNRTRSKDNVNNNYVKAIDSGTSAITGSTLSATNLSINQPVKTDANKVLVSSLISQTDLDFVPLTNPLTAEMVADGFNSTGTNEIKTRFIQDNGGGLYGIEAKSLFKTPFGLRTTSIRHTTPGSDVVLDDNLDVNNKQLRDVNGIYTSTLGTQAGLGGQITVVGGPINLNTNNLTNVADLSTTTISAKNGVSISLSDDFNVNNYDLLNCANVKVTNIEGIGAANVTVSSNLDMSNNDLLDIRSMTTTATQYISRIEDLPTAVGDYYVIPDNTTWIILGQITLQYGIEFGVNCSLRGIDFSATITFDESLRDCSIKAVDQNFYLSHLTIINGGGRFSLGGRGLLDALNLNIGAPAPFYGRNKRFKVTDCNILRPYKIGTVEGFGTLNVTNNFFNGGGGLAGQASDYYTNEGLAVSDGLSLEFNNNKMVLMAGAQQVSILKLLNMKARVSPLLGFNAVTITGNIFHPRGTETGIDFDGDSRTQLGNISGNVFIRTGGSEPLINYENQTLYDNYNPVSIENYSINANTGVVNSEPNLKSAILASQSTTAVNPSRTAIVPTFNDQIIKIDSSARFAIQLDCSGVTVPFVPFERIQYGNNPAFHTAYIMAVEPEVAGLQTIYVTDMSTNPLQIPNPLGGWTSPTGACSSALYQYRWRYSEKDPRKLVTVATFTISTGNNELYYVAPGNGVADVSCEVSGVSNNAGVGGTVSLSCTRLYFEGDIINFFLSSGGGSATSIVGGIINIK